MRWLRLAMGMLLVPLAAASEAATATANLTCADLPSWGVPVGIAAGTVASIGINIGQNLQADGLRTLPEELRMSNPAKSKQWIIGQAVFISFSILNFAALSLAPASVLVPLESIQFVTNVAYNRVVHKGRIPVRMLVGVGLAVTGTVLSVVFGASGGSCHTQAQLEKPWVSLWAWWVWIGVSISVALVCFRVNTVYERRVKNGESPPYHELIRPVTFTLYSALLGGSQMIVQSKVFSELLTMLFTGIYGPWVSWIGYVALFLVVACGMLWVIKMTTCLGIYDPLLILPLMVATYILFGGIAGGIYFEEFNTLHEGVGGYGRWGLYVGGMLFVLLGLYCIATAGLRMDKEKKLEEAKKNAKGHWSHLRAIVKATGGHLEEPSAGYMANGSQVVRMHHPALLIAAGASSIAVGAGRRLSLTSRGSVSGDAAASGARGGARSAQYASAVDAQGATIAVPALPTVDSIDDESEAAAEAV